MEVRFLWEESEVVRLDKRQTPPPPGASVPFRGQIYMAGVLLALGCVAMGGASLFLALLHSGWWWVLVVVVLLLSVVLVLMFFASRRGQDLRMGEFMAPEQVVAMTDTGLRAVSEEGESFYPWQAIAGLGVGDQALFVFFRFGYQMQVIPRRAFTDAGHLRQFMAEIERQAGVCASDAGEKP